MNNLRIAVLASTNGTDLQAIICALQNESLTGVELAVVASNKDDCGAIQRTQKAGFPTVTVSAKDKEREEFDKEMAVALDSFNVDLIIMIGYMRIVSPWFVKKYWGKLANIHPSLLPKYPGMDRDVHEEVLANNEAVTGCTLHFVDEGTDTGPIILQEQVTIEADETVDTLRQKVQKVAQEVNLKAIDLFRDGKVRLQWCICIENESL